LRNAFRGFFEHVSEETERKFDSPI
jgi:hypothetical protein